MSSSKKYQIDMCHGPLFSKIVFFSLPLMASNVMGLMFHAADLMVLGHFAPVESMAAVGATNGLTVLILNIFYGISTAVNVYTARYIGAKDREGVSQTVHNAVAISLYGGVVWAVISILLTKPLLRMMMTPENILDKAALYMWIFCIGSPALIAYSFGSAILRATGDTKRPLLYMLFAGILNVLLNLFFVLVCKMDVAGVAIATKFSNVVAATLVLRALMKANDETRLVWKKVKIYWKNFWDLLRLGVPAGIQGAMFSVSNVIIQSSVNSFGGIAIAGNTAVQSLEGMAHVACSSYYLSAISFTGQNYGAKKYKRMLRCIFLCIGCTIVASLLLGGGFFLFGKQLIGIYNPDPEVIRWGLIRARFLLTTYFLCGIMEVITASLRGLGYSLGPTIVTLLGVCVFRVFWAWVIFPMDPTLERLLISYPISWILVSIVNGIMLYVICRKLFRNVVQKSVFGTLKVPVRH